MGRNHNTEKDAQLTRFGVSMETDLLGQFDRLIERKGYATRSEAFRDMARSALMESALVSDNAEAIATISLVYNHHVRNLSAKLTEFQHHARDIIVSTTHIHIDAQRCLEVLIVRGPHGQVRELAEHLISVKGVEYGKFVTTLGEAKSCQGNDRMLAHHHSHARPHSHTHE